MILKLPFAVAAALLACSPAWALSDKELLEKATQEGSIHIFTNELAYGKILVDEFAKRFHLKVEHDILPFDAPQSASFSAFENEDSAKRADVVLTCQEPSLAAWLENNWAAPIDELPNWNRSPRPLNDSSRYAYFLGAPHVIIYNKKLLKEADIPKTYAALLDPKWKGKVVLRSPLRGNSGAFLVDYMHHAQGNLDWYSNMAQNGAWMADSGREVHAMVGSGQFPIGLSRDVEFLTVGQSLRDNIGWRFVDGELPFQFQLGLVSAAAPHPAAARLFMNWVLSAEAESILEKRGFTVGRRLRESLKRDKVWFMDVVSARKGHVSRLHAATRRLQSTQIPSADKTALGAKAP